MPWDAGYFLDLDHILRWHLLPFDNRRASKAKVMSYLGEQPALGANEGHAVGHTVCLPQGSRLGKPICFPTVRREFDIIRGMEIGHRIKQARQNAGLSQRRLAEAIGVTHGSVGQWESHKKMPGRENLRLIAEATGVSADQLLGQPSSPIEARGGEEAKLLIKFR